MCGKNVSSSVIGGYCTVAGGGSVVRARIDQTGEFIGTLLILLTARLCLCVDNRQFHYIRCSRGLYRR